MSNQLVKGSGCGVREWREDFVLTDTDGLTALFSVTQAGAVTHAGISGIANGTVALPGMAFTSDLDTGIYRIGANNLGVAANGAKVLDVSATGLGVVGTALAGDGTVALPSHGFSADTDTGMYRIGANNLGLAVAGAKVVDVAAGVVGVTGRVSITTAASAAGLVVSAADGSNISADIDGTGSFRGLYVRGAAAVSNILGNISVGTASALAPSTGLYVQGSSSLNGSILGGDGTVSLPEFSFASDTNTGLYSIGADNIGMAVGGVKIGDFQASLANLPAVLTLGFATANNTGRVIFNSSSSATNWRISTNDTVSSALEFCPSTTGGGSTYTTPTMTMKATQVGINGTPNANAVLDLVSTTKGFRPPVMTTTQRDAISSPTAGLVVFNSSTAKLNVYTSAWEAVTSV